MDTFTIEEPPSPQRRQVHTRRLARGALAACFGLAVLVAAYFAGVLTPIAHGRVGAAAASGGVAVVPLSSRPAPATAPTYPSVALPQHRSKGAVFPEQPGMAVGPQPPVDQDEAPTSGWAEKMRVEPEIVWYPLMDEIDQLGPLPAGTLHRPSPVQQARVYLLRAGGAAGSAPGAQHGRDAVHAEDAQESVTQHVATGGGGGAPGGGGGAPGGGGGTPGAGGGAPGAGGDAISAPGHGSSSAWTSARAGFIPGGESGESAPNGDSGSSAGAPSAWWFHVLSPARPGAGAGETADAEAVHAAARAGGYLRYWRLLFPAAFLLASVYILYESRVDARRARARVLAGSELEPYAGSQRLQNVGPVRFDSEIERYLWTGSGDGSPSSWSCEGSPSSGSGEGSPAHDLQNRYSSYLARLQRKRADSGTRLELRGDRVQLVRPRPREHAWAPLIPVNPTHRSRTERVRLALDRPTAGSRLPPIAEPLMDPARPIRRI